MPLTEEKFPSPLPVAGDRSVQLTSSEALASPSGNQMSNPVAPGKGARGAKSTAGVKPFANKRPVARRKYVKKAKKPLMPMKISYRHGVPPDPLASIQLGQTPLDSDMPVLTPEEPLSVSAVRPRAVQSRLTGTKVAGKMMHKGRKARTARIAQSPRQSATAPHVVPCSPAMSHRSSGSSHRSAGSSPSSDPTARAGDSYKLSMHINYISGYSRPHKDLVFREHTYSKPHNWQPEHDFMRPTRYLFAEDPTTLRLQQKDMPGDDILDIETVDAEPCMPYNASLSNQPYEDKAVGDDEETAQNSDDDEPAWDENISRDGWSAAQTRLFTTTVAALEALELRRLVCLGSPSELATMQTAYGTYANEMRYQLVICYNDYRLPVWLHVLLMAHLPGEFKRHYAELLARMQPAIPHIVDVMVKTPLPTQAAGRLAAVAAATNTAPNIVLPPLGIDNLADTLIREKFKRLPNSPVFLVIPDDHRSYRKPRFVLFTSMLSQMGQTYTVQHTRAPDGATILQGLDHKMAEARSRLIELRSKMPGRQMVLVGFNTGAALAAQLALMEPVFAIVCLGFPYVTPDGTRGRPDDSMLTLRIPVMFVIGEHSHLSKPLQIEMMRSRMVINSQLVVMGMCDDNLVMPRQRMLDLKVTQPMVDKSMLAEIHTFLGQLLMNPNSPSVFVKSKMPPVYKRLVNKSQHQLVKGAGSEDTGSSLKTTTRRYVKKPKIFQAASKRKSRVSAAQQLMINSAKYASELPADYAAKLQDSHLAPGLWQSRYKGSMLSPTKQLSSPQSASSGPHPSPPPVSASAVFITPPVPGTISSAPTQSVKVISSSPNSRGPRKPAVLPTTAPLIASSLPSGCFSLSSRTSDRGGMVTVLSPRLSTSTSAPATGPRTKLVMLGDKAVTTGSGHKLITVTNRLGQQQPLTADNILSLPIIFAKDESSGGHGFNGSVAAGADGATAEGHKVVNKFEFSKPKPGVKYRKIFLTRMSQPLSDSEISSLKPGIKTITIRPNAIVDSVQASSTLGSSGGILGRQLAGLMPRATYSPALPRMLGPLRHMGPGRPPGRSIGPGRPPGPARRGPMGDGRGVVQQMAALPVPSMTDDLKFEVFLEDLEEDLGKRGEKRTGAASVYQEFSTKKPCV